jgi:hypothetical protein
MYQVLDVANTKPIPDVEYNSILIPRKKGVHPILHPLELILSPSPPAADIACTVLVQYPLPTPSKTWRCARNQLQTKTSQPHFS